MDFIIRYFKDGEIKCRYLSSGFLGHTTAKDLKRVFEECTEKLDLKNLIQVSMDGPNVNWKMLDLIVEDNNSNETYPNIWYYYFAAIVINFCFSSRPTFQSDRSHYGWL